MHSRAEATGSQTESGLMWVKAGSDRETLCAGLARGAGPDTEVVPVGQGPGHNSRPAQIRYRADVAADVQAVRGEGVAQGMRCNRLGAADGDDADLEGVRNGRPPGDASGPSCRERHPVGPTGHWKNAQSNAARRRTPCFMAHVTVAQSGGTGFIQSCLKAPLPATAPSAVGTACCGSMTSKAKASGCQARPLRTFEASTLSSTFAQRVGALPSGAVGNSCRMASAGWQ